MAYKPTAPHPLTALGCLYRFPPTLLPSNTGEVGIRTGYRLATSMTALDDPAPSCHLDMAELEDALSSPFQYRCFMVLSSVFSFSLRRIPFHGHCDGVWRASATEGARRIWFVMDRGPLRSGSIDFYSSQTQHRCRTKISLWPGSCLLAVTVPWLAGLLLSAGGPGLFAFCFLLTRSSLERSLLGRVASGTERREPRRTAVVESIGEDLGLWWARDAPQES